MRAHSIGWYRRSPDSLPISDISLRSCLSSAFATLQPAFSSPTRFSLGTRTLSKKVWQNSELPLISSIG